MSDVRLIDANALMEKFGELTVMLWLDSVEEAEIASLIGNAPTIEPKQGHWEQFTQHFGKNNKYLFVCDICSECKKRPQGNVRTDFCPNCGANMRERKNNV